MTIIYAPLRIKYSMAFAVQPAETKWHDSVPYLIFIATVIGGWQLLWVPLC
jgi:hypothetical protein